MKPLSCNLVAAAALATAALCVSAFAVTGCDLTEVEGECVTVNTKDGTADVLPSTCYDFNLPASQFDFDGTCEDWCAAKEQGPALATLVPAEPGTCPDLLEGYDVLEPDAKHEGVARCVCDCEVGS